MEFWDIRSIQRYRVTLLHFRSLKSGKLWNRKKTVKNSFQNLIRNWSRRGINYGKQNYQFYLHPEDINACRGVNQWSGEWGQTFVQNNPVNMWPIEEVLILLFIIWDSQCSWTIRKQFNSSRVSIKRKFSGKLRTVSYFCRTSVVIFGKFGATNALKFINTPKHVL